MTKAMPEYRLQEHVTAAARQLGYHVYHTFFSVRSQPGFPDLCMVKAGRLLMVELKRDGQEPRHEQRLWLDALAEVPCCEVYVWHGSDWESGEIVRVLAGQEAA